jgi:hypothetical protein
LSSAFLHLVLAAYHSSFIDYFDYFHKITV